MSRRAAAVAVDLTRLAAVDGHVAHLAAPVALDLGAVFLNVSIFAARVALLLVLKVTVTSQVACSAAGVTALISLALRLSTVFGDVAASSAVVADVLEEVTVLSMMTRLTAAVADARYGGGTALRISATGSGPASSGASLRAHPGPVARAATPEALITAHGCGEIFQ